MEGPWPMFSHALADFKLSKRLIAPKCLRIQTVESFSVRFSFVVLFIFNDCSFDLFYFIYLFIQFLVKWDGCS
ncbi:hypothetical protein I7I53_07710 [Histoplasma capsulatum var. duboisii H88]|uniref:Uncharacterized protein n=1 Tax=Ajellomyces capsulatus (strain H88) TaxID=544711 RepID=A0A8A1LJK0_AJEC8|nr:hypothetical protein I7I53_07710 [Histoplasma capsulatum var. duboisii H88]